MQTPDAMEFRLQALWAAVVRKAVHDYVRYRPGPGQADRVDVKRSRLFRSARDWLFRDDRDLWAVGTPGGEGPPGEEWGVSFPAVCMVMGLQVADVRRMARNTTKEDIDKQRGIEMGYDS